MGRVVPPQWVLGIFDTTEKRGIIIYIKNRSAEVLEREIKKHVRRGSEIWTDKWKGYSNLSRLGYNYVHKTVNHSKNFKDPVSGVCTNYVEGYWSKLKRYLRQLSAMSSSFLPEYIDQFMWKEIYGSTAPQRFSNLVQHIKEKY